MNLLDQVRDRLNAHHPYLRFTEREGVLTVHAVGPKGFEVSIAENLTVSCGGWHEHFATADEALNCFAFILSGPCRLKVTYRGIFACKWILETLVDDRWGEASTTGLFLFPFWRKRRIEYFQNGKGGVA